MEKINGKWVTPKEVIPKWLVVEDIHYNEYFEYEDPEIMAFETKEKAFAHYFFLQRKREAIFFHRSTVTISKIERKSNCNEVWADPSPENLFDIPKEENEWVVAEHFKKIERFDIDSKTEIFKDKEDAIKYYDTLIKIREAGSYNSNIYIGDIYMKSVEKYDKVNRDDNGDIIYAEEYKGEW